MKYAIKKYIKKLTVFDVFVITIVIVMALLSFIPKFDETITEFAYDQQLIASNKMDLMINDIEFPEEIHADEEYVFSASVKNNGNTIVNGFIIKIEFGDDSHENFYYKDTINPGNILDFDFEHVYYQQGGYTIEVSVEESVYDDDQNMENNELNKDVEILNEFDYTYYACNQEMCVLTNGIGEDECITDTECIVENGNTASSTASSTESGAESGAESTPAAEESGGDPAVIDILFSPEERTSETEISIIILIKNDGNEELEGDVNAILYYDYSIEAEQDFFVSLSPGEEKELFMDVEIFQQGIHDIVASISPTFADTDTSNNILAEILSID
ncbi:CARDB domain-containing protein [Candidatus Aenigmatarchaeota archaeon]